MIVVFVFHFISIKSGCFTLLYQGIDVPHAAQQWTANNYKEKVSRKNEHNTISKTRNVHDEINREKTGTV